MIVVNWNRRELLHQCLRSLDLQTYEPFEVIVIDNGSSDGSLELLESLATSFRRPLRVLRNQENRGFCAANNQGFDVARGEYLALLNNDAEADPNWLAALVETAAADASIGMVASKILVWEDPRKIDKCGHLIYPDGQNRGRGTGQIDHGQFDRVEEALWPDGCAALYRREMIQQIGGFDEDFFAYADDAELGLRARIAGWGCLYTPHAVVRHHRGATLGLGSAKRLELIERNRVLLVFKLFPVSLLCQNGVYLLARIAAGLWAALRNRGDLRHYQGPTGKWTAATALLRGTLSALPRIPLMLRKRRAFRPLHRLSSSQIKTLLRRFRISLKELSEQSA